MMEAKESNLIDPKNLIQLIQLSNAPGKGFINIG